MKNIYKILISVMIAITIALPGMYTLAADNIQIVQIQTMDQDIFFYVKGIEENVENVSCTIGNMESENIRVSKLKDLNASLCTYIMIDNSASIPAQSREGIKKLLTELFAARTDNEKFAIATFGENVNQMIGYTNDYIQLKDCIAKIEFNNQDTYLTDMIYNAISSDAISCEGGDYVRLLLIADGMDGDSIGYTKDELDTLIMSAHIPIYSLGVYNNKKTNKSKIEKMFALSRLSGGNGYLYDDIKNVDSYNTMLAIDRDITVFGVTPKADSLDGSEKTIKLRFQSGGESVELVADRVRMGVKVTDSPQNINPKETENPSEPVSIPSVPETDKKENFMLFVVASASVSLAVIVVMIFLLFHLSKRKEKETEFKPIPNNYVNNKSAAGKLISHETQQMSEDGRIYDDDATMMIWGDDKAGDDNITNLIWNNNFLVTLTDITMPTRQYQAILKTSLLIGKSQECSIVISRDSAISRKHFSIAHRNGAYYLKDEGSSNGTFVNKSRITEEIQIKNGDIIQIGRTKLEFSARPETQDYM